MDLSKGLDAINPLRLVGDDQYAALWQKLFVTVLAGFWGRFLFLSLVLLAVFFGIRRRNPRAAAVCAVLAGVIAYGSGIAGLLKLF